MSNSLFNQLNPGNTNIIAQFAEFKKNFKGDPQQEVMKLVQSGRISQDQLNMLQSRASQLMGILK